MTGQELYELYQEANAEFGEMQRDWTLLPGWERHVWNELAQKLKGELV